MVGWLERLERRSQPFLILAGLGVLVVIGIVDYLTGFEMQFSVFYLLGVGLAAWFVGKGFGLVMSVLSVLVWIGGDLAAGAPYSNPLIPVWNALILMVFYFIVVWLLSTLRSFHLELEATVRQRTQAKVQGSGTAQASTAARDKKLRELDAWVSELRTIARVAFYENPQELEKLGVMALNVLFSLRD